MLLKIDPTKIRQNNEFPLISLTPMFFLVIFSLQIYIFDTCSSALNTTFAAQNAYSGSKNTISRSFHRVNFRAICKYVIMAIAS